jgi:uncharacterized Rmd1/YagE family protein
MPKSKNPLGYSPLPPRSVSPLDRLERGVSGDAPAPSRPSFNPAALIGRRSSAPPPADSRARSQRRTDASGKPLAPGQPAAPARARDRFISLPDELHPAPPVLAEEAAAGVPTIFEDLVQGDVAGARGRITTYCVAESIDRKALELRLRERDATLPLHSFPDVIYGRYETVRSSGEVACGDVFYFDYGVIVLWNLAPEEERTVIRGLVAPALVDPLPATEVERDEFSFHYTASEKPHIQNDTFTINYRLAGDHLLKLSISHALAQSTKLSVYESRVMAIVEETKDLPEALATVGEIRMGRRQIAQLIGRVFLQRSAVNLLSTVLDTPEFFWSAPDAMQALYKRCCEYLEYDNRVEVLNSRFGVLAEMLDMLRDQANSHPGVRLEWIVIWLILVEVLIGLLECASILGWVGRE